MLRRLSIITATVGARASLRRLSGRPSSSSLIEETKHLMNLTQQLGSATLTLHAEVKELTLENQQLRCGVIALVRAVSDKAVAASPALWTLRDQVIRLEQVQVLAGRLEAAKPSTTAAVTTPKAWLAGRGAPENERQQFYRIKEMLDQAWEQKVGLSLTKQGLVYAAVPLIVMAMIVYPLMDCATGHHHCVFQHDAKGLGLALHPP